MAIDHKYPCYDRCPRCGEKPKYIDDTSFSNFDEDRLFSITAVSHIKLIKCLKCDTIYLDP